MLRRMWINSLCGLLLVLMSGGLLGRASAQQPSALFTPAQSLAVAERPLDAVAVSPRGDLIAAGGRDALIRLYNVAVSPQPALILPHHIDRITALDFSPDGGLLAAASADGTVSVWAVDALFGAAVPLPLRLIAQHSDVVTSVAFAVDPDGRLMLASGGRDGLIWLGDPATGADIQRIDQFGSPVWALAFSPVDASGRLTLASAAEDGTIWLWGMGAEGSLRRLDGHDGPAMQLRFDATGQALVSGGIDSTVRVWDLSQPQPDGAILRGHRAPVTGIGWMDRVVLITASMDGSIRAWDTADRAELAVLPGTGHPLTGLALRSAEGAAQLAAVGTQGRLDVLSVDLQAAAQLAGQVGAPPVEALAAPQTAPQQAAAPSPAAPSGVTVPKNEGTGARILIPVASIDSAITTFPLAGTTWAIDPWERAVGFLEGTAWVDQIGNVALGGHSAYPDGRPGVFAGLYNVSVGDVIIVAAGGTERRYVVTRVHTVRFDDVSVVYPTPDSRLTLITCDLPSLDPRTGEYLDRLVVVARLVS